MKKAMTIEEIRDRGIRPKGWDDKEPEFPTGRWKCCVCGREFPVYYLEDGTETRMGMCNPDPLGDGETQVCCESCDGAFVFAARVKRCEAGKHPRKRENLRKIKAYFVTMARRGAMGTYRWQ